ncbi:hypothetical protein AB6A40_003740 [Gnathostoma spinigerum]|uniref:Uncharacterized protein n=1 Tax=Gnathostoma spinigerum TaxID=75299 RepID=A0ABD6EBK1_9BILA
MGDYKSPGWSSALIVLLIIKVSLIFFVETADQEFTPFDVDGMDLTTTFDRSLNSVEEEEDSCSNDGNGTNGCRPHLDDIVVQVIVAHKNFGNGVTHLRRKAKRLLLLTHFGHHPTYADASVDNDTEILVERATIKWSNGSLFQLLHEKDFDIQLAERLNAAIPSIYEQLKSLKNHEGSLDYDTQFLQHVSADAVVETVVEFIKNSLKSLRDGDTLFENDGTFGEVIHEPRSLSDTDFIMEELEIPSNHRSSENSANITLETEVLVSTDSHGQGKGIDISQNKQVIYRRDPINENIARQNEELMKRNNDDRVTTTVVGASQPKMVKRLSEAKWQEEVQEHTTQKLLESTTAHEADEQEIAFASVAQDVPSESILPHFTTRTVSFSGSSEGLPGVHQSETIDFAPVGVSKFKTKIQDTGTTGVGNDGALKSLNDNEEDANVASESDGKKLEMLEDPPETVASNGSSSYNLNILDLLEESDGESWTRAGERKLQRRREANESDASLEYKMRLAADIENYLKTEVSRERQLAVMNAIKAYSLTNSSWDFPIDEDNLFEKGAEYRLRKSAINASDTSLFVRPSHAVEVYPSEKKKETNSISADEAGVGYEEPENEAIRGNESKSMSETDAGNLSTREQSLQSKVDHSYANQAGTTEAISLLSDSDIGKILVSSTHSVITDHASSQRITTDVTESGMTALESSTLITPSSVTAEETVASSDSLTSPAFVTHDSSKEAKVITRIETPLNTLVSTSPISKSTATETTLPSTTESGTFMTEKFTTEMRADQLITTSSSNFETRTSESLPQEAATVPPPNEYAKIADGTSPTVTATEAQTREETSETPFFQRTDTTKKHTDVAFVELTTNIMRSNSATPSSTTASTQTTPQYHNFSPVQLLSKGQSSVYSLSFDFLFHIPMSYTIFTLTEMGEEWKYFRGPAS